MQRNRCVAMIESIAAHYKFDAEAAWESLPSDVQQVLLARGVGRTGSQ